MSTPIGKFSFKVPSTVMGQNKPVWNAGIIASYNVQQNNLEDGNTIYFDVTQNQWITGNIPSAGIFFADGSSTEPSIKFESAIDTGLYLYDNTGRIGVTTSLQQNIMIIPDPDINTSVLMKGISFDNYLAKPPGLSSSINNYLTSPYNFRVAYDSTSYSVDFFDSPGGLYFSLQVINTMVTVYWSGNDTEILVATSTPAFFNTDTLVSAAFFPADNPVYATHIYTENTVRKIGIVEFNLNGSVTFYNETGTAFTAGNDIAFLSGSATFDNQ
jgi:hypothetical protein